MSESEAPITSSQDKSVAEAQPSNEAKLAPETKPVRPEGKYPTYYGVVTRLYPDRVQCNVGMNDFAQLPTRYIRLLLTHPNYASIFSLLMTSGVNKLNILIEMNTEDPTVTDVIDYVAFDFPK